MYLPKPVKNEFTILIADRNPRIREFLKREMKAEGYRVRLAGNGQEVMRLIYSREPVHIVVIDLDLPDVSELSILEKLQERIPTLPVVVHTFLSEYINHPAVLSTAALVEKKGNSIDRLKQVVSDIMRKSYPEHYEAVSESASQPGEHV